MSKGVKPRGLLMSRSLQCLGRDLSSCVKLGDCGVCGGYLVDISSMLRAVLEHGSGGEICVSGRIYWSQGLEFASMSMIVASA